MDRPARGRPQPRTLAVLAALAFGLLAAGCMEYDAAIHVLSDGSVRVKERFALDPDWVSQAGDTFQAARRLVDNIESEGKRRGGKVERFGDDSVYVDFTYPSLATFARAWPDSSDEGKQWDRSLYHRLQDPKTGPSEELILWREGPPDRSKMNANQRMPTFAFAITIPVAATKSNAHWQVGHTYGWRFTERMTKPDSVWLVWPAQTSP
ncbi:MAG TPA: hypothetical protein VKF80_10760 [Candidatus Eisenbacteria bacterium]|nr:hypothetical protein [Candidatus Eisenbacteria bacterium]